MALGTWLPEARSALGVRGNRQHDLLRRSLVAAQSGSVTNDSQLPLDPDLGWRCVLLLSNPAVSYGLSCSETQTSLHQCV